MVRSINVKDEGLWAKISGTGPTGHTGPAGTNASSRVLDIVTVTGSYTAGTADRVIFTDGSDITVTLPIDVVLARAYVVCNVTSATAAVYTGATGSSDQLLEGESRNYLFDGSSWVSL